MSDMFDSGPQPMRGYNRQPSRELSADEISDLERKARKEGKRDIILSQVVSQQSEMTKMLHDVSLRLAHGDKDLSRLDNEQKQVLESIKKIGEQANKATELMNTHISQCEERWKLVRKMQEETRSYSSSSNQDQSFWKGIIAQVLGAILTIAVLGGIMAYLANQFKSNSNDSNNSNSNSQSP